MYEPGFSWVFGRRCGVPDGCGANSTRTKHAAGDRGEDWGANRSRAEPIWLSPRSICSPIFAAVPGCVFGAGGVCAAAVRHTATTAENPRKTRFIHWLLLKTRNSLRKRDYCHTTASAAP